MVNVESIQVVLNAQDYLSQKIDQATRKIQNMGNVSRNTGSVASSATQRIGAAYDSLRSKVANAMNMIRNTVANSRIGQAVSSSGLAQPFLNAAEKIRSKWQGLMQSIRSSKAKPSIDTSGFVPAEKKIEEFKRKVQTVNQLKGKVRFDVTDVRNADGQIKIVVRDLQNLKNNSIVNLKVGGDGSKLQQQITMMDKIIERTKKINAQPISPKLSPAGLATLNGELNRTTMITSSLNTRFGTLGTKIGIAFSTAAAKVTAFKSKLNAAGQRMQALVGGLSGVQSAIMGAFGAVGVTSLTQFTIGAAIARQKVNAVTKEVVGSGKAFQSVNKKIKASISGTTLGYNNMATAINNVALRFHLTGEKVGELAGPMSKIGVLAQAMGKSTEEAASVMEHAFDGLQGKWRALKQYGITEDELKKAGWSGAENDVYGYARALDTVLEKNPKFKEFTHTFEYQFQALKMSIQQVGTEIGMMLLPFLNQIVSFFLDLNKNCPWLTKALVILAIAIVGIVSVLSVLAPIIMMIIELQTLQAFTAMAAYLPYLLIAAAILAVIGVLWYFYNTNETVRNTLNNIANTIRTALITAWEKLQVIIKPLGEKFQQLMQVIGKLAEKLLGVFGITGDAAKNFDWLGAVIGILGQVLELALDGFILLAETLGAVLIPVIGFVVDVISSLLTFIGQLAEAFSLLMQGDIFGFFNLLGQALFTLASNVLSSWGQMFLQMLSNLDVIFGGMISNAWVWLSQLAQTLWTGAQNAVNGFIQWIASLPGKAWTWLLTTLNNFIKWKDDIVRKVKEAAKKAVEGFIEWLKSLPQKAWEKLLQTIEKAKEFGRQLYQEMRIAAYEAIQKFKEKFDIPTIVRNKLDETLRAIQAGVGRLVSAMRNLAWNMWNAFWSQFGGGSSSADNLIGHMYESFESAGETIRGMYEGLDFDGFEVDGTVTTNNQNSVAYSISQDTEKSTSILDKIHDLLRVVVDQQNNDTDSKGDVEATLEQRGTITIQHEVNLANVPDSIDEENLIAIIKQLITSKDIIKELVNNREFQALDQRVKKKIIGEYDRHV